MPGIRRRGQLSATSQPASESARPSASSGTFVLGLGAQKAGTTWLADYLRGSPQYYPGFRKEYHVFDSLDLASEEWMRRRIARFAAQAAENVAEGRPADAEQLYRLAMVADTRRYFGFFASVLNRGPKVRATGDLTPDYQMLSSERMSSIKAEFAALGIRTVAIFLMRDPVERVWSHIRMKAHRHPRQFTVTPGEVLLERHAESAYAIRTRYHHTLDAMHAAFSPDEMHVGLYETMFTGEEQVRAISRLASIDFRPPALDEKKNAVPRFVDTLPEETLRTVATTYADTYRGVAERLPDLDIARWWPHSRYVL